MIAGEKVQSPGKEAVTSEARFVISAVAGDGTGVDAMPMKDVESI